MKEDDELAVLWGTGQALWRRDAAAAMAALTA